MVTCMLGTFLISYFVISTATLTELETGESQFISFYASKHKISSRLRPFAVITIQRWWRFMLKRRRNQNRILEIWRFSKSLFNCTLKRKKLLSAEAESIGDLAKTFIETKDRVFKQASSDLKKLKTLKTTQDQLNANFRLFEGKVDRYKNLIRESLFGRRLSTPEQTDARKFRPVANIKVQGVKGENETKTIERSIVIEEPDSFEAMRKIPAGLGSESSPVEILSGSKPKERKRPNKFAIDKVSSFNKEGSPYFKGRPSQPKKRK